MGLFSRSEENNDGFSSYLILCSFFLSIANTLGSAGKLPGADSTMHSAETYRALVSYTSGIVLGCFLARIFEQYAVNEKVFIVRQGAVTASILSVICIFVPLRISYIPNGLLGIVLGSVIIGLRAVLGEANNQKARNNLIIVSAILSGMSIFVPLLVIKLDFDKFRDPYIASAICCALGWFMAAISRQGKRTWLFKGEWSSKRNLKNPEAKMRFNSHTALAIASLASINTCVIMAIFTLPIVRVSHAGSTMGGLLTVAAGVWLSTNALLFFVRRTISLQSQLMFGLSLAIMALGSDILSLALNDAGYYLLGQIPVYIAAMLLQATLFARIAQTDRLSIRAFGTQAGLQVGIATLVVILATKYADSIVPAVGGQIFMLLIVIISGVLMRWQWQAVPQMKA